VVAGRSADCSQKIVNLLAAIRAVDPRAEVFAFLDSDAVPHERWLASLVEPLGDKRVGAATGYRWYVPSGSWLGLFRCVWNASTVTFLGNHGRNFCWGGSTALRRETFERLGIRDRWPRVLSEDYEVTRSVRAAGLGIHFVPRCVIPSDDSTTWKEFWRFARRQLVITRVCSSKVWTAGAVMAVIFNVAFWGLIVVGLLAPERISAVAWFEFALIYALAAANGLSRGRSMALLFPDPALRRGATGADALGAPVVGLFNLALMAASAVGRRFWWRGILYDMRTNEQVRVLKRAT
jgi:cellulose synthase/poly-beta-1,6-N-acetylglucosamine synthase-like glycosyltransferase